ncbi:hypothetical protein RND81_03G203100 [Saponaria officinalis]|uniref:BED-type domain-containing protein n=1 Tax=Saponaria officinalis TaxID=3572 RepID=A0AAW1M1J7_SAPOF
MTKLNSDGKDHIRARCNYCLKTFSAKSDNGTSHMARHIEKCEARRHVDIKSFSISSKIDPGGIQSMTLRDQIISHDEIRKSISMFVVAAGFKYMASCMCPNYTVMSRHTVRRDALKMYDDEKQIVESDIVKEPGRIAFTSDNWRNGSTQDEYICITAHWIDCEWKLQKRIIRFGALTPPYDGINIGDDVYSCLTKWNVANKVACFTLDNATYNNVMTVEIKRQLLRSGKELLFDGQFFKIRCCCHIINLIVQAGLKLIDNVVDKIRAIVRHFRHSIPKKKKFYEVARQIYHLDAKKRLRGDCCVRWNSTYLMLDRALYFKCVIDHVIEKDHDLRQYMLNEEEWEKVSTIHGFLKRFYDITNEFSPSKTPTSNVFFKGVWEIQCLLLDMVKGELEYLVDMVKLMQNKFDKYWDEYNLLLSCACVLDPRYKLVFVEYCYTTLYGEKCAKEKTAKVLSTLRSLLKGYSNVGKQCDNGNNVGVTDNCLGGNERLDNFGSWMNKRRKIEVDKTELDVYLVENNHDYNAQLDVLDYWKRMTYTYPQLAAMARDVLAIPISSVPSESAFIACYEDWLRAKGFSLKGSSLFAPVEDDDEEENEEDA